MHRTDANDALSSVFRDEAAPDAPKLHYRAAAVRRQNAAEAGHNLGGVVLCPVWHARNVQYVVGGLLSLGGGGH